MKDIEAAFVGRVGSDAVELRTSAGGKSWASFSVVVGDGDEAQWVKLVVFGEGAQQLAGHLHKGDRVYVEGRLKLNTWTGKDGKERTGIKVAAWRVEHLGEIGRNKPVKLKAPPEGEHNVPPAGNAGPRQALPDDEIPF